ncbi:MAG: sulfur oxidation c-type cytochrome SoxA [Acetobacteraceae bacterium]|nr:sulfur oxidation c-type cytochrome SoxA [Acetobacteraceae bacterium]
MMRLALLGVVLLAGAAAPRSGYQDASPAIRSMQDDDAANPGFLWVQQGEAMWQDAGVASGRSCASCHGAATAMRGVAARYPEFDPAAGHPVTLEQRINNCRTARQGEAAWKVESDELLAITAFVGEQSRGLTVAVDTSGPASPFAEKGKALFTTRMGQLNLSCAQCHAERAGEHLAGALIPQGQPNGYPLYRLEWQSLGSLFRRIRSCLTGVRATPFEPNSADLVDLEFYLASRANGLAVETPAVRP